MAEVDLVAVSSCLYVMVDVSSILKRPKKQSPVFLLKVSILDGDHPRKWSPSIVLMVTTIRANGRRQETEDVDKNYDNYEK